MPALTSEIARGTATLTWKVLGKINALLPEGDLPSPSWAPGRLLKQRERTPLATGVPRRTQSLCPDCNREAVEGVLKGEMDVADFRDNPGVIEAEILEEGGRVLMRKACEKHGPFEDALSNHPDFFRRWSALLSAETSDAPMIATCTVMVRTASLRAEGLS